MGAGGEGLFIVRGIIVIIINNIIAIKTSSTPSSSGGGGDPGATQDGSRSQADRERGSASVTEIERSGLSLKTSQTLV